jgi:hypothetical protein
MTMTRPLKRLVCLGLVGQMLFAQLAVAAYACPVVSSPSEQAQPALAAAYDPATAGDDTVGKAVRPAADGMVDCDQMAVQPDKVSPDLCAGHCHYGLQIDQVQGPPAPALALISLYTVAPMTDDVCHSMSAMAASVDAPVTASPPHAILHCCFRI